ncbi:MAG: family 1 glycosylhydrolase [Chitinophagaceae bacterium]
MSTETKYPFCNPEIWAGLECTINRVDEHFRDQLADTGHYQRPGDIAAFAELGIKKIRYPILWEQHQPGKDGRTNWRWISGKLEELRKSNIVPIAGLLHHGSGPVGTDLLQDEFPVKLAAYAATVATRFPWIEYYTPVNEPLTTARFSGLYGFWYPHRQDEFSYVKMLLNQVKAIILCMEAIRKINPQAKLVQTEDLAKTHSTALLAYQAEFENQRRWLTYDLLCGKFTADHFFWNYFLQLGIKESELNFFTTHCCTPDIIGFNYYATSERYLDENIAAYEQHLHGGNHQHRYADTDAVRSGRMEGLATLLSEAWQRYQLPMAVTECHLNCTREEQMRWLHELWTASCRLNAAGIPVKAVTAWALLGAYDWDSLLLEKNHRYESGIFDAASGALRPTILAKMITQYARGKSFHHPLLEKNGWWHSRSPGARGTRNSRPLLIIGDEHARQSTFIAACENRGIFTVCIASEDVLATVKDIRRLVNQYQSWSVLLMDCMPVVEELEAFSLEQPRVSVMLPCENFSAVMVRESENSGVLLVENNALHYSKFVDYALDLLIDEEKGCWQITDTGATKLAGDFVKGLNVEKILYR